MSELMVRARRGAAVVELDFDDAEITGMREVPPGDVHSDLAKGDATAVERGFARRGGKAATMTVLDGTFTRAEVG